MQFNVMMIDTDTDTTENFIGDDILSICFLFFFFFFFCVEGAKIEREKEAKRV